MTVTNVSGTWADLIPIVEGERVILAPALGHGADRLADRGAVVASGGNDRDPSAAAVVVIDGSHIADLEELAAGIDDGGRLVVLSANRWSPLRLARSFGSHDRRSPTTCADPRATRRRLESTRRVTAVHAIALFPDPVSPTSAYRMDRPSLAELVLGAATVGAGRARRSMLGAFRRGARFGISWHAPPAWMIVAHVGRPPDELVPTGRIGVAANEQGIVLLGAAPDQIEKQYRDRAAADRVAAIHAELVDAGLDIVNPVRSRPSPTRLRFDWVAGSDIDESVLDDGELARWSARAASVLGRIHGATGHDDGSVMTHGDFWLGALIADGDEVVGVIDWTDGGRGRPDVDIAVLRAAVHDRPTLDTTDRHRILAEMARRYEEAGGPPEVFAPSFPPGSESLMQ